MNNSMTVFHAKKLVGFIFDNSELPKFPEEYTEVGTVDTNDLNEAYALTQNSDTSWVMHNKTTCKFLQCRSTSVGDVIKTSEGKLFMVANFGFEEIQATTAS